MTISTTDSSLPSYFSPVYRAMIDDWNFVGDIYRGRGAWIATSGQLVGDRSSFYLPKEPDENDQSYANRLRRSSFERRYGNAIDAFAGILSRFAVTGELPRDMADYINSDISQHLPCG